MIKRKHMLNFVFTFGAPFRKNEVRFDIILRAKIEPLGGEMLIFGLERCSA